MKSFDMSGKTVMITGASRGIGEAAAHAFAQAGANVALLARSVDEIAKTAGDIGKTALAIPCDVSRHAEVEAAVAATARAFGGLDVLVGNAGMIAPIGKLTDTDPEAWGHAVDVNLKGVYYGMHAVLPGMIAQGHGTILTVSSGAAHGPIEGWSAYCSAKAGAYMLTRSVDMEARDSGIRVMGLSPGTVATQMQRDIKTSGINPVSKLDWADHYPPEWPAKTLVWMCSPAADAHLGQDVLLREQAIQDAVGLS